MATVPVAEKMTAEEFLAHARQPDAPHRELIDGEIVVSSPSARHSIIEMNLLMAMATWSRAESSRGLVLVPIDVKIDRHNVFAPDLLWYADGRGPEPDAPPPYALPDIAVEIRSPSTWRYNLGAKKTAYEGKGLPELWLVDTPAQTVLVFRRSSADAGSFDSAAELGLDEQLTSPLLPGFAVPVADVFHVP